MNSEAKVLQALDAAQDAFRRARGTQGEERAEVARTALQQVIAAPWAMVTREEEADQHGWLGEMREALQKIAREPQSPDVERWMDEGLWAANELERDMRRLVGAR